MGFNLAVFSFDPGDTVDMVVQEDGERSSSSLGRMALEHPCMQMIAVLECNLPLVVAEFLTASGVKLNWTHPDDAGLDKVLSMVDRMAEWRGWCVATRAS